MKRNELRAMLLEQPYDALVLTSEISRRYATGFHSTAGAVYLSAKQIGRASCRERVCLEV